MRRRRASLVVVAVLMAACGTRVNPHEAGTAALRSATGATPSAPGSTAGPTSPGDLPAPSTGRSVGAVPAPPTSPGTAGRAGRPTTAAGPGASPTPGGSAAPKATNPVHGPSDQASGPVAGTGTTTPVPGPGPAPTRSPVVIATVGTLSGPVGAVFMHILEGVQVWVKAVNARGGVNGHPVKQIIYDDAFDPARHRAQVQEAIEVKRVIAFVGNAEGGTGESSQQYITAKRIPVIGSETGSEYFYRSPMYFPQASHGLETFGAALQAAAQQAVPAGKVKLATLACVETQVCADGERVWAAEAQAVGFQLVSRSRPSLTQPDFTAECLAARNAGAQVVMVGLDTASIGRVAASCARQGYRPVYATLSALIADRMKTDANLDGMVGSSNVFPYFQSGTPASDEYQQAMRDYGPHVEPGAAPATGWVSAKLFEKAAAHLPEPPTADAVLAGLWTLRDDTLGGLTQPLTFVKDQPAKRLRCWFTLTIHNGAWVSPDLYQQHCRG